MERVKGLPTLKDQMMAKFGRVLRCGDCLHGYRVDAGDGVERIACYHSPPQVQLVQVAQPGPLTASGHPRTMEAIRQVPTFQTPDQFCGQFVPEIGGKIPGNSGQN